MPGSRARHPGAAFTLIELLAVVMILALATSIVAPNLGWLSGRQLRHDVRALAGQLELARQRAIATGVAHRVHIDLEDGSYRTEWLRSEGEALAALGLEPELETEDEYDLRGNTPLSLTPPREIDRAYRPVPGTFGQARFLDDDIIFAGLETPHGWVGVGASSIEFEPDGTATYTEIVVDDQDGGRLVLAVLPIDDLVRIHDE